MPIEPAHSAVLLEARDLCKSYAGKPVVHGVSFKLHAGEVLGFLGPNGAGKTTTVGMLYGAVEPDSGDTLLTTSAGAAADLTIPRQGRDARRHMGIVTQDDNLDPDFDARENLIVFARHYGIRRAVAAARVDQLLARVGLTEHARKKIDELSGGLKRRLVLARALLAAPRVVFLDEPTTGLDPDSRQDFWRLVSDLRADGCGVILTTHYMDEAQRLCDRLILMQDGRQVDEGTPDELIQRTVGREVLEIEGLAEPDVKAAAEDCGTWWRPFGAGHLIPLPPAETPGRANRLSDLESHPDTTRTTRRRANLEDVFLRLTGGRLD